MNDLPDILREMLDAPDMVPETAKESGLSDMAHNPHAELAIPAPKRPAAVLVPLIPRGDDWQVLLMQRSHGMPTHAGQISFPGGGRARDDADLQATALREFGEETGIDAGQVEMLGRFEAWGTVTGFVIHPFVGVVHGEITPDPDPREVDELFEVPFSFVTDLANFRRESRHWRGAERFFHAVPYGDRYIWGATAGMLQALAQRLAKASAAQERG